MNQPDQPGQPSPLEHERLDVYRLATEFLRFALRACDALAKKDTELRDQLRRRAIAIPVNVAEACGQYAVGDRTRYFSSARCLSLECAALVDVAYLSGAASQADAAEAKKLLERMVTLLTRLSRASSC
jgi:four helix bundle protein